MTQLMEVRATIPVGETAPRRNQASVCFSRTSTRRPTKLQRTAAVSEGSSSRIAAQRAVDAFVKDGCVIGLGHGSMVMYAIEHLASRLKDGQLQGVSCLTASNMASVEAAIQGLPLKDSQDKGVQADVTLFEADEVDCSGQGLALITGRAYEGPSVHQPQLPKLQQLLSRSKRSVALVSGQEAIVRRLGGALPIFIGGENWEATAEELDDLFLGDAEVWRRPREGTANPRGGNHPFISQEGHNILDIRFLSSLKLFGELASYRQIAKEIEAVPGVVTHGLLIDVANAAVVAQRDEPKIIEKGLLFGFADA